MKWEVTPCGGVVGVELQLPSRQWQKSPKHQLGPHLRLSENTAVSFDPTDHTHTTVSGFKDSFKVLWSAALCQIFAPEIVTLPGAAERAERAQSPSDGPAGSASRAAGSDVAAVTDPWPVPLTQHILEGMC